MRAAAALFALMLTLGAQPPNRKQDGTGIADRWLRTMTLRQKVAQLVVVRTHGSTGSLRGREWRNIVRWVRDTQVGGIIVVNRVHRGAVVKADPDETLPFINRLQRLARVPLLVGGDFERSVSMRFEGPVSYPHAMAYAATGIPERTAELGRITAREARALGFQWIFAPVADVNNNPANPIVGIRSFGVDAQTVASHVRAFVAGAHAHTSRALVTVKHYPGHGDTDTDSHRGTPVMESDRQRLNAVELVPFRAAISAGVDAVMTAHIVLPKIDPSGVPATISKALIGDVLRKELGFEGLVVTDAMDMEALAREYGSAEASVRALEAGVDVLLMPRDPDQAITAILKAVAEKRLTVARIETSVRRVLRAKVHVGLHQSRIVSREGIAGVLESEESLRHSQRVADGAVAMLRGKRTSLPLAKDASTCIVAMADRHNNDQGRQLAQAVKDRAPLARVTLVDPDQADVNFDGCGTVTLAVFLGFGGTGQLSPEYAPLIERVKELGKPMLIAAVGNPFLTRAFPEAALALTTYSTVPASETALAKVLFGELTPTGRAFVTFEK